jgi:sRNA-binding protein
MGKVMASKKKHIATKVKRSKANSKPRKKAVSGAASRKKKAATKKPNIKKVARKRVPQRPKARQRSERPESVVQDTIVDIVDEPLPGVVRVTEIEEVSVATPDEDDEE